MTLQEILDEIKEKYPSGLSDVSLIRKINMLLTELYRLYYRKHTATEYTTTADLAFYPLDFSSSNIIDVLYDGSEIPYNQLSGSADGQFYYLLDNSIGIYPTPKESGKKITVFHYKQPKKLSISDLGFDLDFDPDFHKLIVYGVCKEVAENYQDFDLANGFFTQYEALLKEFRTAQKTPGGFEPIQDVYGI